MHSNEKNELCPDFEVKIFTKSLHRGGVTGGYVIIIKLILLVQIADDNANSSLLINGTELGDGVNEVETDQYFL